MSVVSDSPLRVVGVVGLGLLGRGIAACLVARGVTVRVYDRNSGVADAARQHVQQAVGQLVERGGFPKTLNTHWTDSYRAAASLQEFSDCDFVIESVQEDLHIKHTVFDELEAVISPGTPLASNTSALPITLLQQRRRHPQRMIGMHWAEPCHLTRFLEVVRGEQTDDATADAALHLGRLAGKDPTLVRKDIEGFIVNRLGYAMYREAFFLLEQGVADVDTIDRAFRNAISVWGNIAGPFRWMDLTGLPAYAKVMERLFPLLSCAHEVPERMRSLVDSGALGIANGRGFYNYTPEEAEHWEQLLVENVWRVNEMVRELFPEETT